MSTAHDPMVRAEAKSYEKAEEARYERWARWPIHWSAVWVGALSAFSVIVLLGLVGTAVGAHVMDPDKRLVDLKEMSIGAMVFSVCAAFFAFVVGGWVAGKIAGILHSEPGMLQGAIVWLVAVPILVAAGALGAGSLFGGWYAGLGHGTSAYPHARPDSPGTGATTAELATYREKWSKYDKDVEAWDRDTPKVTRNVALGAATSLLLGLIGSVIGGWLASGEPMNFSHHRTRKPLMYHT